MEKSTAEDNLVVTPMSELAFGRSSMSELALEEALMSEGGFEGSISDVKDSSESTMRSNPWVDIADDRGLVTGGGGAARFFRNPVELKEVLLIPWLSVPGTVAKLLRLLLDCDVCASFLGVSNGTLFLLGKVSGSLPEESGLSLNTEASWYPELSLLLRL